MKENNDVPCCPGLLGSTEHGIFSDKSKNIIKSSLGISSTAVYSPFGKYETFCQLYQITAHTSNTLAKGEFIF